LANFEAERYNHATTNACRIKPGKKITTCKIQTTTVRDGDANQMLRCVHILRNAVGPGFEGGNELARMNDIYYAKTCDPEELVKAGRVVLETVGAAARVPDIFQIKTLIRGLHSCYDRPR